MSRMAYTDDERPEQDRAVLYAEIARLKCELTAANELLDRENCPREYVKIGDTGPIYCLHGASSISALHALQEKLTAAKERLQNAVQMLSEQDFEYNRKTNALIAWHSEIIEAERRSTLFCIEERAHYKQLAAANQARIDALMMEYCPDEMTGEQITNWQSHQREATE